MNSKKTLIHFTIRVTITDYKYIIVWKLYASV